MPPWTCRPDAITRRAASPDHTLAVDAATEASGSPAASDQAAWYTVRAHALDVDEHVGAAVLDRLERADRLAELHSGLGVLAR